MRTTITIDADTLDEVVRLTHGRTRSAAIRAALAEFIRQHRKGELLAMRGRLDLEDDWAALRQLEVDEHAP